MASVFESWLQRRALAPDGDPIVSNWSQLLPVRRGSERLMMKAAMAEQEIAGSAFLQWLDGEGAARVLGRQDDAVLLERLDGPDALAEPARQQGDCGALAARCGVALHGDIHHANVMQRANGDWTAIDPKGLVDETSLDFAMMIIIDMHAEGGIGDAQGAIRRAPLVADHST